MQSQETNNSTGYNVRRLTQLSVLLTIAIIIFVLELQLPPLTPIPGIKMGLSNIITLVIILLYNKKDLYCSYTSYSYKSSIFCRSNDFLFIQHSRWYFQFCCNVPFLFIFKEGQAMGNKCLRRYWP